MEILKAQFVKGIVVSDVSLENTFPQVAFVGRSNVGKSSVINSLVKQKKLARSSTSPGRTQQINLYLINDSSYFLDLPGYGYARASKEKRGELQNIIHGYLFQSEYKQKKVVLVVDAKVGPTKLDLEMIGFLKKYEKNILVLANKIDKIKPNDIKKQLAKIQKEIGDDTLIPYSSTKNIGRKELLKEVL